MIYLVSFLSFMVFFIVSTMQHISFRVRTQESEEFSLPSVERHKLEISTDSVYIVEEPYEVEHFHYYKNPPTSSKSTQLSSKSLKSLFQLNAPLKMGKAIKNLFSLNDLSAEVLTKITSYKKCPNVARTDVHNRAYGAMFGLIIGDILGSHLLNKPSQISTIESSLLMNGGGVMDLRVGQGSDQWEINLSLAEGLIAGKGTYNREIIASKYLQWIQSNPCDLPVLFGIAFSQIRRNKKIKTSPIDARRSLDDDLLKGSLKNSKKQSSLGLQRLIPLVIWSMNLQDEQFNWVIRQQMKLIVNNDFVTETALIFATMLRTIITTGDTATAYFEAASSVCRNGSQKMVDLWNHVQEQVQIAMNFSNANHLKFPFCFAFWQLMKTDPSAKDAKQQFIEAALRVLSRRFNTDINCSIVLGVVGAILGYNNIPNYFRDKILNSQRGIGKRRTRQYWSGRIIEIVNELMKEGPIFLDEK